MVYAIPFSISFFPSKVDLIPFLSESEGDVNINDNSAIIVTATTYLFPILQIHNSWTCLLARQPYKDMLKMVL